MKPMSKSVHPEGYLTDLPWTDCRKCEKNIGAGALAGCVPPSSGLTMGIVSVSSLLIGVAASAASKEAILVAGVAGLVAGSMSMAVAEYVSASSQRDRSRRTWRVKRESVRGDHGRH